MPGYTGASDGPDRAKAVGAVVAVHAALAFIILTGLRVDLVSRAVDQLKTFNILAPPPAPQPPLPKRAAPRPQRTKAAAAPPALKARPTEVVAPPSPIPVPSPIPAARVAGSGTASSAGAAASGTGTGAGGNGNGSGGGGYADYSRFTPARLISNIPNAEYGMLAATGIPSGSVGVHIVVNVDGSVSNCRIARSSGDAAIDALICELTGRYVRFAPARDPNGRPVAQDITYFPSWRRR